MASRPAGKSPCSVFLAAQSISSLRFARAPLQLCIVSSFNPPEEDLKVSRSRGAAMEGGENKSREQRYSPPSAEEARKEEVDDEESAVQGSGAGRFYECVFCRGGFTTAQALGGHMNIHRRDRARMRLSDPPDHRHSAASSSAKNEGPAQQATAGDHAPASSPSSYYCDRSRDKYQPYLHPREHVAPSSEASPAMTVPGELSLFGGADSSLPSHIVGTSRHSVDSAVEKKEIEQDHAGEVDLELRLGHKR